MAWRGAAGAARVSGALLDEPRAVLSMFSKGIDARVCRQEDPPDLEAVAPLRLHRRFKSGRSFHARGVDHPYFYHTYNETYRNERAVEIPIVWSIVQRVPPERVLEVGDVLSHYFPTRHDVVDKYEQAPRVQNVDVVDFRPAHPTI